MTTQKKTDNHNLEAKLMLRRYFLEKYHADKKPNVLDCCMGAGILWKRLRLEYDLGCYLGLDIKRKKGRLKIDSARYLAAGGWSHDVIDIDTYGSPWKHWFEVLKNCRNNATVFLTIGLLRIGGGGAMQTEAKKALGIYSIKQIPMSICGALHNVSFDYCIFSAIDFGWSIVEAVEATSDGNARYVGIRIKKVDCQPPI